MSYRFQDQPIHIKLWRLRWYLLIPYFSIYMYFKSKEPFRLCWSLSKGIAQCKMRWVYDWDEILLESHKEKI